MATATQLDRISVRTKAIQTFTIPPMPKMPDWVVRQFKLEAWQDEMDVWRRNTQDGIRSALSAVQGQNGISDSGSS